MSSSRFKFDSAVKAIAAGFDPQAVQYHPAFPDLISQPDLLISPRPGTMIALFSYFPERSSALRPGLEAVEDVFEIKLAAGESTVAVACVLDGFVGDPNRPSPPKVYSVIQALFDSFIEWPKTQPDSLAEEFVPVLRNLRAKTDNERLWKRERLIVKEELRRFTQAKYAKLIDGSQRASLRSGQRLEQETAFKLQLLFPGELVERYSPDVVGSIAGFGPRRGLVRFDFGLGQRGVPVEVIRLEGSTLRHRIRNLMAKSRLLRYGDPDTDNDPLRIIRPLLIVDGNIAGPSHDPARYARALVSVGWEIVHISELERISALLDV